MHLDKMYVEEWFGNRDLGRTVSSPAWQAVEEAIRNLDGKARTSVFLHINEDHFMGIGGNDGRYTVMIDSPGRTAALNLIDPSYPEGEVILVVGGQASGYPERMCVGLDTTIQAAKVFAELGEQDSSLHWEE